MKKKLCGIFFAICLCFSSLIAATKQVMIDSIKTDSDFLVVDFKVDGLLDEKIAEGLRKGRTSTFEYKIQLWSKNSAVLTSLLVEKIIRMKVNYDFWENKYLILTPNEKRLTKSIETAKKMCTEVKNYKIILTEKLNPELKYFLVIEIILRPLSVENYEEIKNWLSGEVKDINLKEIGDPEQQESGVKNRLLRVFMAITGFGDRIITNKSKLFTIVNNQIVW
jgi:hypothetical protein